MYMKLMFFTHSCYLYENISLSTAIFYEGMLLNSKLTEELGAAKKEIEILKNRLMTLEVGVHKINITMSYQFKMS